MAHVDYFYSLMSPWTYLAGGRLEKIAARHGATITYRPADLPRVFAETGGLPLPKRHPRRQEYRLQELRRWSEHWGMKINIQPAHWPVDALPASLAVLEVAARGGDAGALTQAFLTAVWAEDRDLSDPDTIAAILTALGHDAASVMEAAPARQADFDANTDRALEVGVFGAPFYVIGDERFWGQDRLDFVDRHLAAL